MKIVEIVDFLNRSSVIKKDTISLVVLGGSRGCGFENENSDYDLNFYPRTGFENWESGMNTFGFVKIGKHLVHWYFHPMDLTLVNMLPEIFYYAKMPLQKEECFLIYDDVGKKYKDFLNKNADDISLYFLKKLFEGFESENKRIFANGSAFPLKWRYGLALLANYFGFSNYSKEEILEYKNNKNLPMDTRGRGKGIENLMNFVIRQSFSPSFLFEENKKWKQ